MALAGGVLGLGFLIWRRGLWRFLREAWFGLANLVLTRGRGGLTPAETKPPASAATMPYGVAIALGMAGLVILGPIS
jgi:hypothetical protein